MEIDSPRGDQFSPRLNLREADWSQLDLEFFWLGDMSNLDVGDWQSSQVLGAQLKYGGMDFSVKFVALVLQNIEDQFSGFFGGINLSTVSGLDHDVLSLLVVGVQVSMLVSAFVGDVLSDRHAVESHVSEGDSVGVVLNLVVGVQVIDEVLPSINGIHLGCEDGLFWLDASLDILLVEVTVDDEFVGVISHVGVDVFWSRFHSWVTQFKILAGFSWEVDTSVWSYSSLHGDINLEKMVIHGSTQL